MSKRLFAFTCSSLLGKAGSTSTMRTSIAWLISPLYDSWIGCAPYGLGSCHKSVEWAGHGYFQSILEYVSPLTWLVKHRTITSALIFHHYSWPSLRDSRESVPAQSMCFSNPRPTDHRPESPYRSSLPSISPYLSKANRFHRRA